MISTSARSFPVLTDLALFTGSLQSDDPHMSEHIAGLPATPVDGVSSR